MYCANGIAERLSPLFESFDDSVLSTYFEGIYGDAYSDNIDVPNSAVIVSGDFYFCAGDANFAKEAVILGRNNKNAVYVPRNKEWTDALLKEDSRLFVTDRYHMSAPKDGFDTKKLEEIKEKISDLSECRFELINEAYYNKAKENDWSAAFVSNFKDWWEFSHKAFGYVITKNGEILSGCSCYTYYSKGFEIEVATAPEYRRKGLAKICAAAFLLECVKRGARPHWDARNEMSRRIAEKCGFIFKDKYTALEYRQEEF